MGARPLGKHPRDNSFHKTSLVEAAGEGLMRDVISKYLPVIPSHFTEKEIVTLL